MAEEVQQEIAVKEETKVSAQPQNRNMVANLSEGIYSSSDTFKLACQMAKGLANSTIVPQAYQRSEANCLVALELANRMGQSPLQVMQSLDVIQGTPAWRGKALIGFVNNSHKYDEDIHFEYEEKDGTPFSCYAWTKKNGEIVKGTKYTMKMAEDAGLLKKNNSYWLKEPELMLAYRAISRFCSLNCPEISLGLYTREEVMDFNVVEEPKKASINDILNSDEVLSGEVE